MTSLRQRVIDQAALMAGGAAVDPERYAHLSDVDDQASRGTDTKPDTKQQQTLRPAGEASNPALDALPQYLRAPVTAAVGERLTEQELEHAAVGVLIEPADANRYLRAADYIDASGRPDTERIRAALESLALQRPHLAAPRRRREATAGSGQGAGQGVDSMQSRVSAVLAQMNDPDPRYQLGASTESEHYRR